MVRRKRPQGFTSKLPDLSRLHTYSIRKPKHVASLKVSIKQFARLSNPPKDFVRFLDGLPQVLAGQDLNKLINAIIRAYKSNRIIGVGLGGGIIKCGLSPIIIDLMKRGIIKAIAMHGASALHDYEISLIGKTSEDVAESLPKGKFGMAKETAQAFARAAYQAASKEIGLGKALGNLIRSDRNPYTNYSILAQAAKMNLPATVHIALGTDTVHMHPGISGEDLGRSSLTDFRIFTSVICNLNKGVWLNLGSAVMLPEVFLKAFSIARNLGKRLDDFTTANLDMIQHYRPRANVTGRPTTKGINLTGHHEIMLPLLYWGILSRLKR